MTFVTTYGIHFDADRVGWLEQGRGGTNAVGLKARSPFTVRLETGRRHCNHQVPLAVPIPNDRHWEVFMALQDDPLVRAMMPFPKPDAGLYYIADRPRLVDFLVMLSRMSSPLLPTVLPFWNFADPQNLVKALGESNIQPLALYDAKIDDIPLLRQIAQPATIQPRKLLVSGVEDMVLPTAFRKITTELTTVKYDFNELNALPWEVLGATAIKKWMRHEWNAENTLLRKPEAEPRPV